MDLGGGKGFCSTGGLAVGARSHQPGGKSLPPGDILRLRLDGRRKRYVGCQHRAGPRAGGGDHVHVADYRQGHLHGRRAQFQKSQFNRCTQAVRQPGSAFKPIIYAAALDKGYTEASILIDTPITYYDHSVERLLDPCQLRPPVLGSHPAQKGPHPFAQCGYGKAPRIDRDKLRHQLRPATGDNRSTHSDPCAGPRGLRSYAPGMLTAYSTFPAWAERVEPYLIDKVLDRYGNLIEEHQVKKEQVYRLKRPT